MKIEIKAHTLSDYSKAYSVHIGNVEINARTKKDALEMADKIASAIDEHSVDEVSVSA